jgi:formylglycine-generating enzyme required for sulfatase activity
MSRILFSIVLGWMIPGAVIAQDTLYTNSIGMQFVRIHPGSFVAASFHPPYPQPEQFKGKAENDYSKKEYRKAEKLAAKSTRKGFTVKISQSYYIGKYEVTQEQWMRIMSGNPSVFQGPDVGSNSKNHPVENVTWQQVQEFIAKLNAADDKMTYRLPTEFEWEYAARAGATTDIEWSLITASAQLGTRTTNPVGGKKPNAWGLYDMLGNVWEWVNDYYNEKIFADPTPPESGTQHVLKGASFTGDVKNATYMTHAAGPGNGWDVGFRLVATHK